MTRMDSLGYAILVLAVYVLALARLTRLINADKITDRLRTYPASKLREATLVHTEAVAHGQTARAAMFRDRMARWDKVLYFVQCPWCVGMWLAFGTVWAPMYFHENPVVRYVAVALAASHLIGVCARFADTEEIDIEDDDDQ
jgi:hypothetical protein